MRLRNRAYYQLKKLLPRRMQVWLRRRIALRKRKSCSDRWPIDFNSGRKPPGWLGWPEGKQFALVLTHDVDTARGHERCYDLLSLERELGFFSSFNFVAQRYPVSETLRRYVVSKGFEVGLHGLYHDGRLYESMATFQNRAARLNDYLKQWDAVGFRSPAMHHNLEWIHLLEIEYDASTFDTDPFEPQPDGMGTIFPFWVGGDPPGRGYVELPYTMPQDFTLFVIFKEKSISVWKQKLEWVAAQGGMVLVNTHPDYMNFTGSGLKPDEYSSNRYFELLSLIRREYSSQYWHVLPRTIARFWRERMAPSSSDHMLSAIGDRP